MKVASDRKISITKRIFEVDEESVLEKIEEILDATETVAFTAEGKPLSKKEYISHIENISSKVSNGSETYSSDEVIEYIKQQNTNPHFSH